MEEVFKEMASKKLNNVDNIVKWMKDSNVIDSNVPDEQAKKLFFGVENKDNVAFSKFKEILSKVAADQRKPLEQLVRSLVLQGKEILKSKLVGALGTLGAAGSVAGSVAGPTPESAAASATESAAAANTSYTNAQDETSTESQEAILEEEERQEQSSIYSSEMPETQSEDISFGSSPASSD